MLLLLGLLFIPESPRWLAMTGRQQELEVALRKLNGKHADVALMMRAIQPSASVQASGRDPSMKLKDLLAPTLRRPLLVRQEAGGRGEGGMRGSWGASRRGGADWSGAHDPPTIFGYQCGYVLCGKHFFCSGVQKPKHS